ncbi:twin arginine-targeting protein translocase TatB [Bermanella sp. 47_1433_sub80_T6]|nr:twin arginine-targeting protein translocase TatB [Bermanella sp. 47_1433_sub80_T6]
MFDIGFSELMLVGIMALIILGPERLPKAARTAGLLVGRIRRTMSGIQQEIEQEVRNQEIREKLKNPLSTFLNDEESTTAKSSDESTPQDTSHDEHDHDVLDSKLKDMNMDEQIAAMHAHHPNEDVAPQVVENNSAQQDK